VSSWAGPVRRRGYSARMLSLDHSRTAAESACLRVLSFARPSSSMPPVHLTAAITSITIFPPTCPAGSTRRPMVFSLADGRTWLTTCQSSGDRGPPDEVASYEAKPLQHAAAGPTGARRRPGAR